MANSDIIVGAPRTGTGGILVGPTGVTLPTDATSQPPSDLVPAGYIGDEGITMEQERDVEQIYAWGGDAVRTVQTEHNVTFTWQFLETTAVTLSEVYGATNVGTTSNDGVAVAVTSQVLPSRAYIFEMQDGQKRTRVIVPNLQITEVGETVFVHSDVVRYEVTATAYPNDDGIKAWIISGDGDIESIGAGADEGGDAGDF